MKTSLLSSPGAKAIQKYFVIGLCAAAAYSPLGYAAEVLVEDDFSGGNLGENFKPDAAANWALEEALVAERGGTCKLTREIPRDIKVEVDVSLIPDSVGEAGFAGINLGSALFALRPGGFWYTYGEEGQERALGRLVSKEVEFDKPYRFSITRRALDGGFTYVWEVDGEVVCEFTQIAVPATVRSDELMMQAWRAGVRYDNFSLKDLGAE